MKTFAALSVGIAILLVASGVLAQSAEPRNDQDLTGAGRIGVRSPTGEEQPVVRPHVLMKDIQAAVEAAEAAGAEILMPPTKIPGQGMFAIYYFGKVEHGF